MRAIVDEDICIGCELCVETCPEVFEMNSDKAKVKVDEVPAEFEDSCRDAIKGCPVDAICIA